MTPGLKTLWIKKQSNTNKIISMTINNHRGTSGSTGYGLFLQLALGVIGFMEEIYWRGYLQGYMLESLCGRGFKSLILSCVYYTAVHIPTGNPPLAAAALIVGLIFRHIALKAGVVSSIAAHIV
jgi:membrane protease YdiL (CAAX protease family)